MVSDTAVSGPWPVRPRGRTSGERQHCSDPPAAAAACTVVVRKPAFPTHIIQAGQSTLSSIGPDSWLLFSLLGTDHAWLTLPPAQWSDNVHYAEMSAVIRDLAVNNDTAEHCIKDIQDYANAANDGAHRGNLILVSASHRIKIPSFKNEMEGNIWSLYFLL